jgi:hypothetical protein
LIAIAVRTPAKITNSAFGISTRAGSCPGLMPMPRAASTSGAGTDFKPT